MPSGLSMGGQSIGRWSFWGKLKEKKIKCEII
jgi:hypothetical protein